MPDASDEPVPVANLPPASVDEIKSRILEDNCETSITKNSSYSPGMNISTTDQLQYDAPDDMSSKQVRT